MCSKQAVKHHGHGRHIRKRAMEGGCVLVDTTKSLGQVGELVQAELQMNHIVEIGEIVMLDEQFAHEMDGSDDESAIEGSSFPWRASQPLPEITVYILDFRANLTFKDSEPRQSIDSLNHNSGMSSMASALNEITSNSRRDSRRSSKTSTGGSYSHSPSLLIYKLIPQNPNQQIVPGYHIYPSKNVAMTLTIITRRNTLKMRKK